MKILSLVITIIVTYIFLRRFVFDGEDPLLAPFHLLYELKDDMTWVQFGFIVGLIGTFGVVWVRGFYLIITGNL